MQTFFMINVVDLTLTNCKAHQYYICEIMTYVTMFVLWAITGYLCYKFEFVDYANIFLFDWPWKLIRGESLNIHPWMKVHPWMGSAYSSVGESSSVDGYCVFFRGWKFIRGWVGRIHPWVKVHPWMGIAYSSVDESSSVDGECVFIRGWKFIRGWRVRIHPWINPNPWIGWPHSSVDDISSVDRKSSFIRGCSTSVDADWFYPRISLFLSVNISCNNVHNITKINLRSRGISAMK